MRWLFTALLALSMQACGEAETSDPHHKAPDPAAPSCEPFQVGEHTVLDTRTGLAWDRFVMQSFLTSEEAAQACAARQARLPTRTELLALPVEHDDDACLLPACAFWGARCLTIQCGSPLPDGSGRHWGVAMSGGALVIIPAGQPEAMLCVRESASRSLAVEQ